MSAMVLLCAGLLLTPRAQAAEPRALAQAPLANETREAHAPVAEDGAPGVLAATPADQAKSVPPRCVARGPAVDRELARHRHQLPGRQARRAAFALCHEAERGHLDPLLLLAVIGVESSFDPEAVSPVGAEGLMQLMPSTARYLAARVNVAWSRRVAFDPAINIRIGARYLATLRDAFHGRMDWALTAYNRGPTATHHLLRAHHGLPHAVHASYSMRVLRAYDRLQRQYAAATGR